METGEGLSTPKTTEALSQQEDMTGDEKIRELEEPGKHPYTCECYISLNVSCCLGKNIVALRLHRKEQTVAVGLDRGSCRISSAPCLSSGQEGTDTQRTLRGKLLSLSTLPWEGCFGKRLAVGKERFKKEMIGFFPFNSKSDSDGLCSIQMAIVF